MTTQSGSVLGPSDIPLPEFTHLVSLARSNLIHLLESLPVKKDLVIDPSLMRPLDRIAGAQLLKSHDVNKIYKLESNQINTESPGRMYLVRPTISNAKLIADQIKADKKFGKTKRYKVLYVPRRLFVCDMIMEEEGVYEELYYDEFKVELFPLDEDILSLELPDFFRSFFLDGDQSWIQTIATSIVNLQSIFGTIPHCYGMGRCSKMVFDMVKMLQSFQGPAKEAVNNKIGHLILFDRDEDMVTPLCTQTTYAGLVDDRYGIHCGFCDFPAEVTGTNKSQRLLLTKDDVLFEEIRDRHISNVFNFLKQKAKEVQVGYSKGRNIASIGDMKDFVQKELKGLKQDYKSLTMHVGACEGILKQTSEQLDFQEQLQTEHSMLEGINLKDCYTYIEEHIARQSSHIRSLRFCCLLSLTQNGLPTKDFRGLQSHYLHSNGYQHLVTFSNLKKLGMFTEQTTVEVTKMSASDVKSRIAEKALKRTAFRLLSKRLNLIPRQGEVNLQNPDDMSYVFSGAYTPLSCKLVEQVLIKRGFFGLDDVKKHLSGPCFEEHRGLSAKGSVQSSASVTPLSEQVVLVFFLGGCTFAEIAALRLLGKRKGYRFIFATTAIVTGKRLLESIKEK